jgi:hypothetical protein
MHAWCCTTPWWVLSYIYHVFYVMRVCAILLLLVHMHALIIIMKTSLHFWIERTMWGTGRRLARQSDSQGVVYRRIVQRPSSAMTRASRSSSNHSSLAAHTTHWIFLNTTLYSCLVIIIIIIIITSLPQQPSPGSERASTRTQKAT